MEVLNFFNYLNRSMEFLIFNKIFMESASMNWWMKVNKSDLLLLKISDDKDCAICLTNKVNTIVLPCKHMCCCSLCCEDLRKRARKCPICRNGYQDFKIRYWFIFEGSEKKKKIK
jgi:hypothetical protein